MKYLKNIRMMLENLIHLKCHSQYTNHFMSNLAHNNLFILKAIFVSFRF